VRPRRASVHQHKPGRALAPPARVLLRIAVFMPSSALAELGNMEVQYPLKFRIACDGSTVVAHCGVKEFGAEEGRVYCPFWLMEAIGAAEGDYVRVTNVALPKATFVRLRPRRTAFVELTDPRGVLEVALRNFTCVTTGVALRIPYIGQTFDIDVMEVKPAAAASIVETDVEIDFAPPLDAEEVARRAPPAHVAASGTVGGDKPPILGHPPAADAAAVLLAKRRERTGRKRPRDAAAGRRVRSKLTTPELVTEALGDAGGRCVKLGTLPPAQ